MIKEIEKNRNRMIPINECNKGIKDLYWLNNLILGFGFGCYLLPEGLKFFFQLDTGIIFYLVGSAALILHVRLLQTLKLLRT